jgi:hypothetical protein
MHIQGSEVYIQIPNHWNLNGRSIKPRRLCYRPAIFFHHFRPTVLSLPQGEQINARLKMLFTFAYLEIA